MGMTFDRFLTWLDDGLEPKGLAVGMFARVGFPHWELPHGVG